MLRWGAHGCKKFDPSYESEAYKAFSVGIIALVVAVAEHGDARGCITELIMEQVHAFHDEWLKTHGSLYCADLTGCPSLRDEQVREQFWAGEGPGRCTGVYMRFVEGPEVRPHPMEVSYNG